MKSASAFADTYFQLNPPEQSNFKLRAKSNRNVPISQSSNIRQEICPASFAQKFKKFTGYLANDLQSLEWESSLEEGRMEGQGSI